MQAENRHLRWLWFILIIGLMLRLGYALAQPTVHLFYGGDGGDSAWYLANGWGFFSGQEHGWIRGIGFYLSTIPTPPFYILYAGLFQQILPLPEHETIVMMRLIQCIIGTATAYLAYRLAAVITSDVRAGTAAAALVAFHPAFVIEPANIATETFYIFFAAAGLWLYIEYVIRADESDSPNRLSPALAIVLTGLAFGLAVLTRAVFLLFPLGVAIHMIMVGYRRQMRTWLGRSLLLLLVYAAMASTWTVYSLGMWGRFIIISDQFMPTLWRGAVTGDGSPAVNDALLLENAATAPPDGCETDCKFHHATATYVEKITESVNRGIGRFLLLRFEEWAAAILQPHGTTPLGSVSIRDAAQDWLHSDRAISGFLQLTQIEGFAVKLAVWLFHYAAIAFGLAGMWLCRRSWRMTLALAGFAAYTVLAHFFLLALPRYMFPIEIPLLIFASATIVRLIDSRHWNPQLNYARLGIRLPNETEIEPRQ